MPNNLNSLIFEVWLGGSEVGRCPGCVPWIDASTSSHFSIYFTIFSLSTLSFSSSSSHTRARFCFLHTRKEIKTSISLFFFFATPSLSCTSLFMCVCIFFAYANRPMNEFSSALQTINNQIHFKIYKYVNFILRAQKEPQILWISKDASDKLFDKENNAMY